jgi:hypothetical protein
MNTRSRILRLVPLLAATALPAVAHPLTVTAPRSLLRWDEPATIVVAGESRTACGASAVRFDAPALQPQRRFLVVMRETCALSGAAVVEPFRQTIALPHLDTGTWTIGVDDGDNLTHDVSLEVVQLGTAQIEVASPGGHGTPTILRIRGFGCAPGQLAPLVHDGVVSLEIVTSCVGIPPPAAVLFEREANLGVLTPGPYEVRLVEATGAGDTLVRSRFTVPAGGCVPSPTTLCLMERFAVTATWSYSHPAPVSGAAGSLPIPGSAGSGLLWFFDRENAELTVKAVDGCAVNGHWWIYLASGSDVAYEVRVSDTVSGTQRVYRNAEGTRAPLVSDVVAFGGCGS